ncbi:MAG: type II secretion system F family protein [Deltaproteobacteria bacterium]|nr:type II secretion system F family protein [Deltaproteobacteria bacterium]
MRQFSYKATNAGGTISSGSLPALNQRQAAALLQRQGLIPLRIVALDGGADKVTSPAKKAAFFKPRSRTLRKAGKSSVNFSGWLDNLPWRRPGVKELAGFADDLGLLLRAGVPLNRALVILVELIEKPLFSRVMESLREQVKEGSTFWEALRSHPRIFPPVFVGMVRAGESGGILDAVLGRLALYLNGIRELQEFLIGAMVYPLVLTVTTGASIVLLLAFVLPKFAAIFSDMGVALPTATRVMLACGDFMQAWWWALGLGIGSAIYALRRFYHHARGRLLVDRLILRLPGIGGIFVKMDLARFFRTLGAMLASGVPILEALQVVSGVISNRILEQKISYLQEELRQGAVMSQVLAADPLFPSLAVHMIGVGEETGHLDEMLDKLAEMYDRELKVTIKALTSLFEPLVILFMGLVIGAIVVSMLMAIFSVNELGG